MAHRVIQWATGAQGVESIRAIHERPDLELVGGWVHTPEKDGRDLGELAGIGPIGVTATRDVDALLALGADCVAYMPRNTSLDEVCAILASGCNVVTTAFLFYPRALPADDLARLLDACRARWIVDPRHGPEPGQPQRCPAAGAVGHEPSHRAGDPAGAGRLVLLREHQHHLRQHALRAARPRR